jgi:uncharacterized integral membrane protein
MGDTSRASEGGRRVDARVVVGVVVLIALIAFVVQNTERVGFNFLVFDFTAPLWLMLTITVMLALLVGYLVGRRSTRD